MKTKTLLGCALIILVAGGSLGCSVDKRYYDTDYNGSLADAGYGWLWPGYNSGYNTGNPAPVYNGNSGYGYGRRGSNRDGRWGGPHVINGRYYPSCSNGNWGPNCSGRVGHSPGYRNPSWGRNGSWGRHSSRRGGRYYPSCSGGRHGRNCGGR